MHTVVVLGRIKHSYTLHNRVGYIAPLWSAHDKNINKFLKNWTRGASATQIYQCVSTTVEWARKREILKTQEKKNANFHL